MRFGVNYIPSKNWLYSWLDFDENSIKNDLIAIKELGFDHIRAHLIWSYFQVNESSISMHCLANLKKFSKICDEVGIEYFLTLFTGWMSGFVFMPSWLNIGGPDVWKLGMFSDERAIKAEQYYIEKISSVTNESKSFIGFDLGNELNCIANKNIDENITGPIADAWSGRIFQKCFEVAPGKLHCNGMAHAPWFGNTFFSRHTLANDGTITPVHAWAPFTGTIDKYGITAKETLRLPNYMIEMAKAYCNNDNRMYQVQEFGMADQWFDTEMELRDFIYGTLNNCASEKNMWGVTWWCSHDVSDKYTGFLDFEHNLGLLDVSNKPKPAGLLFRDYIAEYKHIRENYIVPTKALVIKRGTGDENDYTNAERYMRLIHDDVYPTFVTEENASNIDYLKSRGIDEVIYD